MKRNKNQGLWKKPTLTKIHLNQQSITLKNITQCTSVDYYFYPGTDNGYLRKKGKHGTSIQSLSAEKGRGKKSSTKESSTEKSGSKKRSPKKAAPKKASSKRTLIEPNGDKRYVRRDEQGQFKESDNVSRSLSQDAKKQSKKPAAPGQGDKGDGPKKKSATKKRSGS